MRDREELMEEAKKAVNNLIDPKVCGLEEAQERLEELMTDIEVQIDCIEQDLARRDHLQ